MKIPAEQDPNVYQIWVHRRLRASMLAATATVQFKTTFKAFFSSEPSDKLFIDRNPVFNGQNHHTRIASTAVQSASRSVGRPDELPLVLVL